MRTTVNLKSDAYRLARAIASQQKKSVGDVLSEALLERYRPKADEQPRLIIDDDGLPTLYLGRVITSEEVATGIEEE
jgi:hypothetical protein